MGLAVIGGRNKRAIYQTTAFGTTNASSYTINGVAFGSASPRRYIVVGVQAGALGANLNQPDSVTIGGVSATLVVTSGAVGLAWKQIWIAAVPAGTTGTIVVSRSGGNMSYAIIPVWAVYDILSASAVGTLNGSTGNPSTGTLTTAAGGVAVGHSNSTAGPWTESGLTEDVDGTGSGTGSAVAYAAASASKVPGSSVSVSFTSGATNACIAASFS